MSGMHQLPPKLAEAVRSGHYLDPSIVRDFRSLLNGSDPLSMIDAAIALNPNLLIPDFHAALLGLDAYPLVWLRDIKVKTDTRTLIRGLIKPSSMVISYGESNSGKTFHVLDRDISLSAGRDWYGRETESGLVLYVAAEGAHSVQNRVSAYRDSYLDESVDLPFALIPSSINLLHPEADTRPLIEFVKRLQDAKGQPCIKITVDTLSRALAGGNENSPDDMGRLVFHADLIRQEIGCCVEFVHHSGKDQSRGARGHSILRAATDTEIEVSNDDGIHIAKVTKQRDLEIGEEFAFTLRQIVLGQDKYGHDITTCVPEWLMDHLIGNKRPRLTNQEKRTLQMMRDVMSETRKLAPSEVQYDPKSTIKPGQFVCPLDLLRTHVGRVGGLSDSPNPDTNGRALRRCLQSLQVKGIIGILDDYAWLTDTPDMSGQI